MPEFTTIVVLCMLDSIHSARWLSQFERSNVHIILFPTSPHRRIHPQILKLVEISDRFQLVPFAAFLGLPVAILDKAFRGRLRGWIAKKVIWRNRPDFVHAMEIQGAGYTALNALRRRRPPNLRLITTNWGSDIYWFRQFPKHREKIISLLAVSDLYSAECMRDVELAKDLGFSGKILPIIPNAGGVDDDLLRSPLRSSSQRNVIMVKGYDGWVGRARVALQALKFMENELDGYQVVIYSANKTTIRAAKQLFKSTSLDIEVHRIGALTHQEVLEYFSRSLVYVGISMSDGISTSMLEAMAMGAIPVQTDTACCDEWVGPSSAAMVSEIEPLSIVRAIRKGIKLSQGERARQLNREVIRARASASYIAEIAQKFYRVDS